MITKKILQALCLTLIFAISTPTYATCGSELRRSTVATMAFILHTIQTAYHYLRGESTRPQVAAPENFQARMQRPNENFLQQLETEAAKRAAGQTQTPETPQLKRRREGSYNAQTTELARAIIARQKAEKEKLEANQKAEKQRQEEEAEFILNAYVFFGNDYELEENALPTESEAFWGSDFDTFIENILSNEWFKSELLRLLQKYNNNPDNPEKIKKLRQKFKATYNQDVSLFEDEETKTPATDQRGEMERGHIQHALDGLQPRRQY